MGLPDTLNASCKTCIFSGNGSVIDWVDGDDMLDLKDFGFTDTSEAMSTAADVSGDVVFTFGSDIITIEDTTAAEIVDNLII